MDILALLAIASALGAVFALACGVSAMAVDGEVIHRRSEVWMGWRVACQAAALIFIALVLVASAHGAPPTKPDCVYDYPLITGQECQALRAKMLQARSDDERSALVGELHKTIDARARERDVSPYDWRGIAVVPPGSRERRQ